MARPIRKTIYTLNIGDYAPEIRALTYPLMKAYAKKIGANFAEITERVYPEWPLTYEKLQVGELALGEWFNHIDPKPELMIGKPCRIADVDGSPAMQIREPGPDWNIFMDADTLVSPEMFDITSHLSKDTVCHNGRDMAGIRWKYDEYFRRDGRNIGSCNWLAVASDWCLDLWEPLNIPLAEALENINITIGESNSGFCKAEHLIDDYTLSRNIARYGLKFTTVTDICAGLGWKGPDGRGTSPYLWHKYTISNEQKVREILAILSTPNGQLAFAEPGEVVNSNSGPMMKTADGRFLPPAGVGWGVVSSDDAAAFRQKWGIR